jgi:hypothetical protein
MGIVRGSQLYHLQSVLRLHDFFCRFMRWNGGRDEDDLLELERLPDFLCTPEMTEMDRIEGPSK